MKKGKIVEFDILSDPDVKSVIDGATKRGATAINKRLWPDATVVYKLEKGFSEFYIK